MTLTGANAIGFHTSKNGYSSFQAFAPLKTNYLPEAFYFATQEELELALLYAEKSFLLFKEVLHHQRAIFFRNHCGGNYAKIIFMQNDLKIRCIVKSQCVLGESPVWCATKKTLYWVDILDNKIYTYNFELEKIDSWNVPEHIGFLVIKKNGSLIGGLKSGLHHITLNNDGSTNTSRIDRIDDECIHIRFNDGTIDSKERIWCCTMDMRGKQPFGKYFCYDDALNKKIVDEGYIIANGPALDSEECLLYTVETCGNKEFTKGVYVAEISHDALVKKNKKLLIDWSKRASFPDGIVVDRNDNLWIGEFGGNILRCYYPNGRIKFEIPLPAWNITKIAFRYDANVTIYVASARIGANENILLQYPFTGSIIEITEITL
jgi:D-xylonolactonase